MAEIVLIKFLKSIFANKYITIAIGVAILLTAGAFYFHHEVNKEVKVQVTKHDAVATAVSENTQAKTAIATAIIDKTYDAKKQVVQKEYANVRTTVSDPVAAKAAVAEQKDALDPLLLDALNQLARLHAGPSADSTDQSPD